MPAANANAAQISRAGKPQVGLLVVPTDEELMIARHTLAVLVQPALGMPTVKGAMSIRIPNKAPLLKASRG